MPFECRNQDISMFKNVCSTGKKKALHGRVVKHVQLLCMRAWDRLRLVHCRRKRITFCMNMETVFCKTIIEKAKRKSFSFHKIQKKRNTATLLNINIFIYVYTIIYLNMYIKKNKIWLHSSIEIFLFMPSNHGNYWAFQKHMCLCVHDCKEILFPKFRCC